MSQVGYQVQSIESYLQKNLAEFTRVDGSPRECSLREVALSLVQDVRLNPEIHVRAEFIAWGLMLERHDIEPGDYLQAWRDHLAELSVAHDCPRLV